MSAASRSYNHAGSVQQLKGIEGPFGRPYGLLSDVACVLCLVVCPGLTKYCAFPEKSQCSGGDVAVW